MKVLIVLLMVTGIYCIDSSYDFFQRLEVEKTWKKIKLKSTLRSLDVKDESKLIGVVEKENF